MEVVVVMMTDYTNGVVPENYNESLQLKLMK